MNVDPREMANAIRALSMDAVQKANSGHPGMPMGMADVATVLFSKYLAFDPRRPDWPDRDRFVLSAGHGSMLLYSLLYLTGYADMTIDELKSFRQFGSRTAGHPEYGHAAGVETTTGPLGQGLGNAVGMALAERILNARFGDTVVDHFTYVIAGDGCLMEGISHEAASLAGHLKLGKLVVLFDDNSISIDGSVDLTCSDNQMARFAAHGWHVLDCDGHDHKAVADAIEAARNEPRPSLIACKTIIGYGAPNKQGTAATHGAPLGDEEIQAAREKLGWPSAPFEVPDDVLDAWRLVGARGASRSAAWDVRLAEIDQDRHETFKRIMSGRLPDGWEAGIEAHIAKLLQDKPNVATRKASQMAIEALQPALPEMVGGSADLTGSNLTRTGTMTAVTPGDFAGSYIYYGVREHGMAAAMNGMALHGGVIPYGGTFLVFSDYCRPSIRLSALMGQRVIYVMTHDSIGLGEDGPTHQPVEHLAALRAIPNVRVFRPADAVETAECWRLALSHDSGPSVLALSRQGTPQVRAEAKDLSARGGYILKEAAGEAKVTLIATGTEVALALAARKQLQADNIPTAVVSMPCREIFDAQDEDYRNQTLRPGTVRIAVEAASPFGWERYVGENGGFVGMTGFGASAPAEQLYEHFGITPAAIAEAAKGRLG
ncbi:transketolase [Minwuia thermotolerans]|uniref:Transketolase n=2 Tax=Minwuia thermotolerans TaxID=2056226 RepID=A0A2M9G5Q6_9PROT|nr:transketolase [Minwuia thermotolerans]PJK31034.1 transketolase [Minwuia thermotolerans]